MKRGAILLVALFISVATWTAGCQSESTAGDSRSAGAVTIMFQNNVGGAVDPCGCEGNPAGGFAKRVQYIQSNVGERGLPAVVIDAGDLFGRQPQVLGDDLDSFHLLADLAIEVLDAAKTDVFVPGEGDLAAGWDFLRKRLRTARFRTLAANLVDLFTGEPAFPGSIVLERGGIRVGVVGVVSHDLCSTVGAVAKREIRIDDPVEAARRELETLAGRTDLVVLVAHVSQAELQRLGELSGVAFIIGGHSFGDVFHLEMEDRPPVFLSGKDGMDVGEIAVEMKKPGAAFIDASSAQAICNRIVKIQTEIDEFIRRSGGQDPRDYFSTDEESLKRFVLLDNTLSGLNKKLSSYQSSNTYTFSRTNLGSRTTPDPNILRRVDLYKKSAGIQQ